MTEKEGTKAQGQPWKESQLVSGQEEEEPGREEKVRSIEGD